MQPRIMFLFYYKITIFEYIILLLLYFMKQKYKTTIHNLPTPILIIYYSDFNEAIRGRKSNVVGCPSPNLCVSDFPTTNRII